MTGELRDPPPGLELLLRLVGRQLAATPCPACGASLAGSAIAARAGEPAQIAIEVVCRSCDERLLLGAVPDAGDGAASIR